jgi:AraC-like DNA-binding protein
MSAIPSYRSAHLLPYIDFLKKVGAPVETTLQQSHLPTLLTDEDDMFLPQKLTMDFLKKMSRSQGIDDLTLRAVSGIEITDLSQRYVTAAFQSPTLKIALEHFARLLPYEDNDLEFWINSKGSTARLCLRNHLLMDPESQRFEDWNEVLVVIAIVRAFAGADWQPEEIAFGSELNISELAQKKYPNTRFLVAQNACWISLPHRLLSLPPQKRVSLSKASVPMTHLEPGPGPDMGLVDSLSKILPVYLCEQYPSIQLAAEISGTSVRTLQRRLKQSDMSYSDLIKNARFERASSLLKNTDEKIIDIAYQIGYSDPAHFSRAFTQATGLGPRKYRQQFLQH